MGYSVEADLVNACGGEERHVQLFDWNSDRIADAGVMADAIIEADAEINSYLAKVRRVPIANPPTSVVKISARLAVYHTKVHRGLLDQGSLDAYERDVRWLSAVAKGEITLDADPQPEATSMRIDASSARPTTKAVSRKKLHGFS